MITPRPVGATITYQGALASFFAGSLVGAGVALIHSKTPIWRSPSEALQRVLGTGMLWMGLYLSVPAAVRQLWLYAG